MLPMYSHDPAAGAPRIAAWQSGDLDGDSEMEAWLRLRYPVSGDLAGRGHYVILDLGGEPRVAFNEVTQESTAPGEYDILSAPRLEDVDGDGHDDVRVRGRRCHLLDVGGDLEEACERFETVHLWEEGSDSWAAGH
jgi:hypothetical protein